jgi:hypothetical protein
MEGDSSNKAFPTAEESTISVLVQIPLGDSGYRNPNYEWP